MHKRFPLLVTAFALLAASLPAEETSVSESVGYLSTTIRAGTGHSKAYTVLSLPLSIASGASWKSRGHITALTATTLTDAAKDWTAGQWSEAETPWFIRITSGAAAGRSFLLSTNAASTADTLTLDASETADLTTLGITTGEEGDTYEIFAAETLSSIFPLESGVLAGTSTASADTLQLLRDGVTTTYFYSSTAGHWVEASSNADASDVIVHPDSAIVYGRQAGTAISLTLLGTVAGSDHRAGVKNSGQTLLANVWPVAVTLADSGIQNLSGWVSNSAPASADKVELHINGAWRQYFYDGTDWRQIARGNPIKNTELISAASAVLIVRPGSTSGFTVLHQTAPF